MRSLNTLFALAFIATFQPPFAYGSKLCDLLAAQTATGLDTSDQSYKVVADLIDQLNHIKIEGRKPGTVFRFEAQTLEWLVDVILARAKVGPPERIWRATTDGGEFDIHIIHSQTGIEIFDDYQVLRGMEFKNADIERPDFALRLQQQLASTIYVRAFVMANGKESLAGTDTRRVTNDGQLWIEGYALAEDNGAGFGQALFEAYYQTANQGTTIALVSINSETNVGLSLALSRFEKAYNREPDFTLNDDLSIFLTIAREVSNERGTKIPWLSIADRTGWEVLSLSHNSSVWWMTLGKP